MVLQIPVRQVLVSQIMVQIVLADFHRKSSARCDPHMKQT